MCWQGIRIFVLYELISILFIITCRLWHLDLTYDIKDNSFTCSHNHIFFLLQVKEPLQIGQRVCVENHFYCGTCYQCTHSTSMFYILKREMVYMHVDAMDLKRRRRRRRKNWSLVPDLPHICQRMSQYGHGKGTIYGGCSEVHLEMIRGFFFSPHLLISAVLNRPSAVSLCAADAIVPPSGGAAWALWRFTSGMWGGGSLQRRWCVSARLRSHWCVKFRFNFPPSKNIKED